MAELVKDNGKSRLTKRSATSKYLPSLKFSEFNPELARRIILYWSDEGDMILDPFAGRSTRMLVSSMLNRNYIGYEISSAAFEDLKTRNENRQATLFGESGEIRLFLKDGCKLDGTANNSIDMIFTCPPYWNLERYESVPCQLSDCATYGDFLDRIESCVKHCYRVLKFGKFAVWVVADFRKGGFKVLHKDCIDIFTRNGFLLWDIVINVLKSPFAWCQIGKCEAHHYTSKTHEYVLVFKKEGVPFGED